MFSLELASKSQRAAIAIAYVLVCLLAGYLVGHGSRGAAIVAAAAALFVGFTRPKAALFAAIAFVLFFPEETWQLQYVVSDGSIPTGSAYTANFAGINFQLALVFVVAMRTLVSLRSTRLMKPRGFDIAALALLASIVFGEILGRIVSGYGAMLIGHAQQYALPVILALCMRALLEPIDIERGFRWLAVLGLGRMAFGLVRFAAGGGDTHFELGRQIVFWDAADGLIALILVMYGVWGVATGPHRERLLNFAFLAAGLAVIAFSLRRAAMLGLVVCIIGMVVVTIRRESHRAAPWVVSSSVVLALGIVVYVALRPPTESIILGRAFSIFQTSGSLANTNMWHFADIADGLTAVSKKPVFGWGFHVSPPRYVSYLMRESASLESVGLYHNMFINTWVRIGLLGATALIAALWISARASVRGVLHRSNVVLQGTFMSVCLAVAVWGLSATILVTFRMPYLMWAAMACAVTLWEASNSQMETHV